MPPVSDDESEVSGAMVPQQKAIAAAPPQYAAEDKQSAGARRGNAQNVKIGITGTQQSVTPVVLKDPAKAEFVDSDPRLVNGYPQSGPPPVGSRDLDSDSFSSDNDYVLGGPIVSGNSALAPCKADIKSLVEEFAQQERAKGKRPSGNGPGRQKKPPLLKESPVPTKPKVPRREVDYTPATLEEFKEKFGPKGETSELGHLGPDLDDDDLLYKKAMQERMKQFSKELLSVNRQRISSSLANPKDTAPKPEPKPTARAKALEFAKRVPKPKVEPRPSLVVESKAPADVQKPHNGARPSVDDVGHFYDLEQRERQHYEDVVKVEKIKEFISQIAV